MALTFICLNGDSLVSVSVKIWEVVKYSLWVIMRLQLNYAVLIYHSSNKTTKEGTQASGKTSVS